ncbi:hypothetical protein H6F43_04655 [Leptolyngbya sp. FACHB-36]|uniref:ATP-binding protein n=1 Tax=Leptolyngbya sp. FACHB-36 TaxID=2692808 RepID=UPI0016802E43|nr:tetratricopeptide repeat protein [Leptolyngbya sp. FACHB-36]MBD2019476.1 hypothetical protein [Leptolyngbya sp. FACHB-36]
MSADRRDYQPHLLSTGATVEVDDKRATELLQALIQPAAHQLPPTLQDFTGRQVEAEQAMTHVQRLRRDRSDAASVLVIMGKAGIGKSSLATQVAHRLTRLFPDAQVYINLRGTEIEPLSSIAAVTQLLQSLGIAHAVPDPQVETDLSSWMGGRRILALLDNAYSEAQVQPFLSLGAGCAVLVTSRKSLTLAEAATLELGEMPAAEAIELLQRVAPVEPIQTEWETAKAIVDSCGYLPLAIRILGGLLRHRPNLQLVTLPKLRNERQRLESMGLSYPELRASFSMSYQNLDDHSARLLRLLGLLAEPSFTLKTATSLLDSSPDTVRSCLKQLVDVQLIELVEPMSKRYRLHDVIRQLVRGQLAIAESTETRHTARLHLSQAYLEIAEVMSLALDPIIRQRLGQQYGNGQRQLPAEFEQRLYLSALNWFDIERLNLLASIDWAFQTEAWELVLAMVNYLTPFFSVRADWAAWETTHRMALTAAEKVGDRLCAAHLHNNLGNAYLYQQNREKAKEHYKHSLASLDPLQDATQRSQTLANLSLVSLEQGNQQDAAALWESALTLLDSGSLEQRAMLKWMRSVNESLLQTVYQQLGDVLIEPLPEAQPSRNFFSAIGGVFKRWINE